MPAKTTKSPPALLWRRRIVIASWASLAVITSLVPTSQAALAAARDTGPISAGSPSSCTIESGRAYCWGDDAYGELGDGKTYSDSTAQ